MNDKQALQFTQIYHQALIDSALDCIITIDQDGTILEFNAAAVNTFGYSRDQAMGKAISDLIIPERYREAHQRGMAHYMATGEGPALNQRIEINALHKNGHEFPVELTITPLTVGDEKWFTAYLRDITDQKRAQDQLDKLALVAAKTSNGVIITDQDGLIEWVNAGFTKLSGYTLPEVQGKKPGHVLQGIHTDPTVVAAMRQHVENESDFTTEVLNYNKRGEPYWVHVEVQPIKNEQGRVTNFIGIQTDITERHQREEQAKRLRSLDAFAGQVITRLAEDKSLNESITFALTGLTEILGVECGYLYRYRRNDADSGISQTSCVAGQALCHDPLQPLGIEKQPAFKERLIKRDPLVAENLQLSHGQIDGFQLPQSDRPLTALLVFPMRIDKQPPMYIALEMHGAPRKWADQEIQLVQTIGDNLALAIERRINHRERELDAMQLKEALEQARLANQSKSIFLAHMSHEIRTPMSAVLGYAELLNRQDIPEDRRRHLINSIQTNGRHLLGIINDILDFSKIEAGKLEVRLGSIDLCHVLQRAASIVTPHAEEKNLAFNMLATSELPRYVEADETRLLQILVNLLGNAVKFTEEGYVHCSVSAHASDGAIRLRFIISDTGPGINDAQLNHIFTPFESVLATQTSPVNGTGLGLPISRRLAELMGGHLVCASSTGEGSCFVLTIPARANSDQIIEQGPIPHTELAVDESRLFSQNRNDTLSTQELRGKLIFVVDDVIHNRDVIEFFLQEAGAEIVTATNGCEALQWLENHHEQTDVVLMDMQMPEIDGYEATRRIRDEGWALPVIALTAHSMTHERQRCLDAGCDDYLSKPVDQRELVVRCVRAIEKHGQRTNASTRQSETQAHASTDDRVQSRLEHLAKRFADALPGMWHAIDQAWQDRDLERLAGECHRLAGSSASLGFDRIYQFAVDTERCCKQDGPDLTQIENNLRDLERQMVESPDYQI